MTTPKMKILAFLLTIPLMISLFPVAALAATEGNYFYLDNGDGTCTITGYTGSGGDLIIPETLGGKTVTIIGNTAFLSTLLTSVTIPDTVITIQDEAFSTNSITSLTIGNSVETIGIFAFADSTSLTSVSLPPSLTFLNIHAFNYTGMSEITLPQPEEGYISTWENGSGTAFYGGDTVPVDDSYTRTSYASIFEYTVVDEFLKLIKISAYNGLGGDVIIPSTIDGYTVYGIAYCAFANKGVTSVTLPDCLMYLETGVFGNNPGLTSFNLPGAYKGFINEWYEYKTDTIKHSCGDEVTDLNDANFRAEFEFAVHPDGSAFINNCNAEYTDIFVPAAFGSLPIGHIGDDAFFGNFFSGDLTIPDGIISIGFAAFADNELTSVTIPNSVKKIGTYAFFMNPEISSFNLPSGPVGYTSIWSEIDPGSDVMSTDDDTIIGEHRSSEAVTNLANGFEWLRNDINEYTVTFKDFEGSVLHTVTQNFETAFTYPEDPSREGYTFSGWSSNIAKIPAEDVTITAMYTENPPADVQYGTIMGKLIDSDDKPLAGQIVTLHSNTVDATTGKDGRFTFTDVPLTDHTLILKKTNGAEIGRYALSFLQGSDTSYTLDETDVDVKVTASTVIIDILINLSDTGVATIESITFAENPQTGDAPVFLTWMLFAALITVVTLGTVIIYRRRSINN